MDWVWWLRRPAAAWALAGLVLLLTVALIPLSLTARGIQLATGVEIAIAVSFAAVGLIVARHRPRNRTGWLMLWLSVGFMLYDARCRCTRLPTTARRWTPAGS